MENIGSILVVDDDPHALDSISLLLKEYGYHITACSNAEEAFKKLQQVQGFDIVLSDIKMKGISGIELTKRIRAVNNEIPVILMTGYPDVDKAVEAVRIGAFDFIIKPYKNDYLINSIKRALTYYRFIQGGKDYTHHLEEVVRKKTQDLTGALNEVVHRLTVVSEFRDTDTGAHIKRIGLYSSKLAEALDMPRDFIEAIKFASPMHDIGKVGIPDSILLKPGILTKEEFEVMKTHTTIGAEMLSDSPYSGLQMAATIALTHHEKLDGSGYPYGLKGAEIPIESRITMIADLYDALVSRRPYKEPFTHGEAYRIITEGDKRISPEHLDHEVLKSFIKIPHVFEKIFKENQD